MSETAAEIIATNTEVEGDQPTIEEEFRDLQAHMVGLGERLDKIASGLEQRSGDPATKADIAQLYRFVSGDIVRSVNDLVAACGAAFNDVFELIDSDEDEEETDSETPSDEDVAVYTTLGANVEAFLNLSKTPGLSEEQKNSFEQMAKLNQGTLEHFHEAYGVEVMQEAAQKKREEVLEDTGGGEDDDSES